MTNETTAVILPCVKTASIAVNGVASGRGVRSAKKHRDNDFEAESLSKTPIVPGDYVRMTAGKHRGTVGRVEAKISASSYEVRLQGGELVSGVRRAQMDERVTEDDRITCEEDLANRADEGEQGDGDEQGEEEGEGEGEEEEEQEEDDDDDDDDDDAMMLRDAEPPRREQELEKEEERIVEVEPDDDDDKGGMGVGVAAALQEACVELGYDETNEKRKELVAKLTGCDGSKDLPEDILQLVCAKTGKEAPDVLDELRSQVGGVLESMKVAIEEAEKEQHKKDAGVRAKIKEMCLCPAGFDWHRDGEGWRCNGGSHFISNDKLGLNE